MPRLFVSDLDGTLLDPQGRLSDYSREVLIRLLDEGLAFTIASARSVWSIAPILGDLPLTLPIIEFNGAFLTDLRTARHRFCRAIAPAVVGSFLGEAQRRGFLPTLSTYDGAEDHLYHTGSNHVGLDWFLEDRRSTGDPRLRKVPSLDGCVHEQVVCLTVIGDGERVRPFAEWMGEAHGEHVQLNCFDHAYSPCCWLTAHDRRATKAAAIEELAAELGVDMSEVTVFGDAGNDIPMFRAAGYGVAVENADEELKVLANLVIGPHYQDSVVRYLEAGSRGQESGVRVGGGKRREGQDGRIEG